MGQQDHKQAIKLVYRGLVLLAVVTVIEVIISLFGKGHIVPGMEDLTWVAWVAGLIIIVLSLYKAYFIVYEFMHMKHEVKGLALSVLLPTLLLVWAVIAFFQEGNSWGQRREKVKTFNEMEANSPFVEEGKTPQIDTLQLNKEDLEEAINNEN